MIASQAPVWKALPFWWVAALGKEPGQHLPQAALGEDVIVGRDGQHYFTRRHHLLLCSVPPKLLLRGACSIVMASINSIDGESNHP